MNFLTLPFLLMALAVDGPEARAQNKRKAPEDEEPRDAAEPILAVFAREHYTDTAELFAAVRDQRFGETRVYDPAGFFADAAAYPRRPRWSATRAFEPSARGAVKIPQEDRRQAAADKRARRAAKRIAKAAKEG